MQIVNVARDFSRFPSGRFTKHGSTSGEGFRSKFLVGLIKAGKQVTVQMDGAIGYSSSFLEEAFGGTVRELHISAAQLKALLHIESSDQALIDEIYGYIDDAGRRSH